MKVYLSALVGIAALLALGGAWATEPAPKKQLTPEAALQRLKEGNARFVSGKIQPRMVDEKMRAQLAKGQNPFVAVLTCADSRVPPEFLFDQGLGDLFVIRIAGNVTGTAILGSLEYAVDHLHVSLIVVLGHESCGAVKAALEDADPDGNLGSLLREVHVGKALPLDKKEAYAAATKNNVRFHAAEMTKRSSLLKDFAQSGRIQIASGVFSLKTGQIDWLSDGKTKTPAKPKQ